MIRNRKWRVLAILPLVALAVTLFGYVLMKLWNWLMPELFGWHTITFWQALGIFVLSKLLFGGFRGGPGWRGRWKERWQKRMMERWEQMTPEEREKFREGMRHCGPFGPPPASEPKA